MSWTIPCITCVLDYSLVSCLLRSVYRVSAAYSVACFPSQSCIVYSHNQVFYEQHTVPSQSFIVYSHNQFSGEQHTVPSQRSIVCSHNQSSGEQHMFQVRDLLFTATTSFLMSSNCQRLAVRQAVVSSAVPWAARYNTWLLIKLTPKGVVFSFFYQVLWLCQVQEAEERSKAAAAKHESCLHQLSAEHAHTLELDSQIEDQHKVSCAATYHNNNNSKKNAFQLMMS